MLGIATGVGAGAVLGAMSTGWRPPFGLSAGVATVLAMVGSNAPMTALGVSDPTSWSLTDWVSDAVPHAAFGLVSAATLRRME